MRSFLDNIINSYNYHEVAKYIDWLMDEHLLIASHIKPWADCGDNELEERLDVSNGLLLCPNHDKLIDKGFFHLTITV